MTVSDVRAPRPTPPAEARLTRGQDLGTVRGRLLRPGAPGRWEYVDDALIRVDPRGAITDVGPATEPCGAAITIPGALWLPGFVDTHVHFPQTRVLGSATGPLLDWLRATVFPEEARFADTAYATSVAAEFTGRLLAAGTTCAAVFSSSHPAATDLLFDAFHRAGLRGWVGLTLMDRGAPEPLLLSPARAMRACEELARRWDGADRGRLRFCVTPRFALSCTPEMLREAGRLARAAGLPVQTHLSENGAELAATAAAFPGNRDYLDIYEEAGLAGPDALFAHCVWLDAASWDRMAARGAAVAHCPDSNFFLGSGRMSLHAARTRGIRVGLGTDVGAGRTFSLRRVAASGYDNALCLGEGCSASELLWLATAGGAEALGFGQVIGRVEPGFDADLQAVMAPEGVGLERLLDALVFDHDFPPPAAVLARGRVRAGTATGAP